MAVSSKTSFASFTVAIIGRDASDTIVRLRDREAAQQHRVDYAENCRVGSDAKGERQQRNRSEAWVPEQHTKSVAKILRKRFHHHLRLESQHESSRANMKISQAACHKRLLDMRPGKRSFGIEAISGLCLLGRQPVCGITYGSRRVTF